MSPSVIREFVLALACPGVAASESDWDAENADALSGSSLAGSEPTSLVQGSLPSTVLDPPLQC
jgi:hypothetical protein